MCVYMYAYINGLVGIDLFNVCCLLSPIVEDSK